MTRITPISRLPEHGATATTDVKIAFVIQVLQISQPLFTNKDPQNPGATPPQDTSNDT